MHIVKRVESPIEGGFEVTNDTKFAAVIVALHAPLQKVDLVYNEDHPKKKECPHCGYRPQGGIGRFFFGSNPTCPIAKLRKVWEEDTADGDLLDFIEEAKKDPALKEFADKLSEKLTHGLMIVAKSAISNYQRFGKFFREEAEECVVTDREITFYGRKDRRK